ncbi:DUF2591 domain-containing protein [Cronobacter sakazakii]|nr:DUF2591 domain-containing protein [Cronobacter sakazakii]
MDYSKLSDRDIDALVLQQIYGNQASDKDIVRSWLRGGFKYTTNPADAWPIMTENKIGVMWMTAEKQWCAWANGNLEEGCWEWSYCPDEYHHDDNPLRAAMIVFLMMQESQHA